MYILSVIIIIIGFIIFIQYNKSIIHKMIGIEIMMLGITIIFLVYSYIFDDIMGNIYSIYIIGIIGSETGIGLSIIISYYKHYYILL